MDERVVALEIMTIGVSKGFTGDSLREYIENAQNRAIQEGNEALAKELQRQIELYPTQW